MQVSHDPHDCTACANLAARRERRSLASRRSAQSSRRTQVTKQSCSPMQISPASSSSFKAAYDLCRRRLEEEAKDRMEAAADLSPWPRMPSPLRSMAQRKGSPSAARAEKRLEKGCTFWGGMLITKGA